VGDLLLLDIPLPWVVTMALGVFRSSGRFFWPIGYALIALSVVLTVRKYSALAAASLLITAALLQVVDVGPIRTAIVRSAAEPRSPVLDREQLAARVAQADAVMVYPTFACISVFAESRLLPTEAVDDMYQANMETQLAAARAVRPINSVYDARRRTPSKSDCAAEGAAMHAELKPGTLYVYLTEFTPSVLPRDDAGAQTQCASAGWPRYCWALCWVR
jgi:hypothetical protein